MNIKSIRSQMLIYLLVGLLVLFGILIFVVNKELNKLPKHMMSHYQEITDARAAEVNKELEKYVQNIKMISQSPIIKSMELKKIQEYLPHLIIEKKQNNMTIATLDGKGWTTFGTTIDISGQEQYQKIILEGHPYWISQPFISPYGDPNTPIVTVSHEVRKNEGIVGLVNIVLDIQFLKNVTRNLNLGYTGYAWIVDRDGAIIAHPDSSIGFKKHISEFIPTINDEFKRNDSIGYFQHNGEQGEEILTFYKGIGENTDWTLLLSINTEEVLGEISNARLTIILAFVLGMLFICIFAFYYSRSISKPILQLKKIFEKAETGNLNVTADETVKNEIGAAAKSFNQMLRQIKRLTYHDSLTNLSNLNGFLANLPHLSKQLQGEYPVIAIVVISIDDFKRINSISGYKGGNLVLQKLAYQLSEFIEKDERLGRYFGDEFILLLKGDSFMELKKRIQQLWEHCKTEISIKDNEYRLKVSMGIATTSAEIQVEEIVNQANIAKIQAKKDGGNRYQYFDRSINESIKLEQKIENALYRAIEKDELYLVFQPIVDLKLNSIIGTEALIRWKHDKFKKVSPLELIRVAEKAGLIIDIGRWVLTEALKQNKRWQDLGHTSMFVSVNISALQFEQSNFAEMVKEIIEKTSTEPKFLELEITETNAMTMVEEKLVKLSKLKEMGIRIAIDDFGTGYSSLAYFTRFPINTLKIDRSFVNEIYQDENAKTIITTIINMAKSINIATTAEGVETLEQVKFLEKQGCDKIQGFLISEPVEPEKIEQLLKRNSDSINPLSNII